ncbi:MAG: hypothetical protein V4850_30795 [Myxococcota bacterium]
MEHDKHLELSAAADYILGLVRAGTPAAPLFRSLVDWCASQRPHPSWTALRGLDIEGELSRCRTWFGELLETEPPPADITGFYFGVFDTVEDDRAVRTELYAAGGRHGEDEWLSRVRHGWWPEGRYSNSRYLAEVYAISHADGGLENDADYPLGLAFAIVVARELANSLGPRQGECWVAAGFDAGDILEVGSIGPGGLQLSLVWS